MGIQWFGICNMFHVIKLTAYGLGQTGKDMMVTSQAGDFFWFLEISSDFWLEDMTLVNQKWTLEPLNIAEDNKASG